MSAGAAEGGVETRPVPAWLEGLRKDYHDIFVEQWSPYLGAILMVAILAALMISGQFWGIFGGLKLWGDWFNNAIGLGAWLGVKPELESPLSHRMSLMNAALILGSFAAALLSWPSLLGVGLGNHHTLLFAGLITASSVSLATQGNDRGGGVRRALGWTCVLLAGFGAVSIAGPLDPLRAVLVALGALLLEQAVERE